MVETLALLAWLYLALIHGRRFWRVRLLPSLEAAPRRVAVVIPARDEAATIGAAVESLWGAGSQRAAVSQTAIIVVNDNSSDNTAEIAQSAGATVIDAGPLPPGWTGKMWALSRGVQAAMAHAPEYLLFTDADIIHGPGSLARLVALAEHERRDLVSVMVKLRCESLAERFAIPAFVFFFFMLYPPARGRGAAGGCMLIRPSALEAAGGIEAIRSELIDDCALAGRVGSVWLGLTNDSRSIRPYPAFADVRRMIARTAFTQLRYSTLLLAGTVAGLLLLYAVPVISTVRGSVPGVLAWLTMSAIYLPMVRFYGLSPLWAPMLPFVAMFYTAATVESAVRYWTGKGGGWKGRHQAHESCGPA